MVEKEKTMTDAEEAAYRKRLCENTRRRAAELDRAIKTGRPPVSSLDGMIRILPEGSR